MLASYFRKKPFDKWKKKQTHSQEKINPKKMINEYLHIAEEENPSFLAFSRERDHIGRLISPKRLKTNRTPNPSRLRLKVAKSDFGNKGDNLVLVRKNNFLFFDKGKGMKSRPNEKALLGTQLRLDSIVDQESSFQNDKFPKIFENILDNSSSVGKQNQYCKSSLPKLKFVPSAKDANHDLELKRRNLKKVGKIVDPCKQDRAFALISHLGLYEINYSQVFPKEPTFFIAKAASKVSDSLPAIKSPTFQKYKPKKLYEKGEFEDERLLFAKAMKEVSDEVNRSSKENEENLGIDRSLDYRYFQDQEFVKGFHTDMKKGFEYVKKRFQSMKAIGENWEKEAYRS